LPAGPTLVSMLDKDTGKRTCQPSPTLSPTDPVPRAQLWPTGPIYSLYTAYIQPIYSPARKHQERT